MKVFSSDFAKIDDFFIQFCIFHKIQHIIIYINIYFKRQCLDK